MWQYVKEGEVDVGWIHDTLVNGNLIGVTDGSYDRIKAQMVSKAGWVLTCTASHMTLQGSFYEKSPKAGSYRGELLGLVAIHTLILGIAKILLPSDGVSKDLMQQYVGPQPIQQE